MVSDNPPTKIYLSPSLPYPITVTSIVSQINDYIKRHDMIFRYEYTQLVEEEIEPEEDMDDNHTRSPAQTRKVEREFLSTFESPIEGDLKKLLITVGQRITSNILPVAYIKEPCSHEVQYGGLCAVCGKVVDNNDYNGNTGLDRAPITMSHGTSGLKVSKSEAAKIEKNATQKLLKSEKLILVVDLDQTIIHATVDPTVDEWRKDPNNPNYPAIKDVESFSLEEEVILPPSYKGIKPKPTICWYYVKLRPGLQEFLQKVSKMYELHIYTMATRSYAKAISKIVDPDGQFFGDRILTRDESNSLTQKSLKRLFPTDTSMVVIIDDRGDVWKWSDNLIKVVPYDFFVGIGDINSSFLPKQNVLLGPSKKRKFIDNLEKKQLEELEEKRRKSSSVGNNTKDNKGSNKGSNKEQNGDSSDKNDSKNGIENETSNNEEKEESSIKSQQDDQESEQLNPELLAVQASERNASLEQQQHERPLAELQKSLEHELDESEQENDKSDEIKENDETNGKTLEKSQLPAKPQRNLLFDDDTELSSLQVVLTKIHDEFFDEYKVQKTESKKLQKRPIIPDIEDIMPRMKQKVFDGCVFLFSGLLPMGVNLDSCDVVLWTRSFGATVVNELLPTLTHIISNSDSTEKVQFIAANLPECKIVNPDWLFKCISSWKKVPEDEFIIDVPNREYHGKLRFSDESNDDNFNDIDLKFDWMEVGKEVDDFLASSDDDEEEEEISEADNGANNTEANLGRKRSREDDDDDDNGGTLHADEIKRVKIHDSSSNIDDSIDLSNDDDDDDDDDIDDVDFEADLEAELDLLEDDFED